MMHSFSPWERRPLTCIDKGITSETAIYAKFLRNCSISPKNMAGEAAGAVSKLAFRRVLRAEGPIVNRPGREAGIAGNYIMSTEGATQIQR